jgi:hypothetical protein
MKSILTTTALASVLVFGLAAHPGVVRAEDAQMKNSECVGDNCPGAGKKMKQQNDQMNEQSGEEATPRKRKHVGAQSDTEVQTQSGEETVTHKKRRVGVQQTDVDVDVNVQGDRKWRFDSDRHRRSHNRSATFRFYYGGWWYPEPYWTIGIGPGRISCGEGRLIVAQRFNRVRVVECRGGIYTYLGRRQGDTFRVMVNSRNGRIVGRDMI